MRANDANKIMKEEIIYKDLSYKIVGLCYETHNALGRFRNEKQYADFFEQLLIKENIGYQREYFLPASFEGENKIRNKVDFIIEDCAIIDFKAKTIITKEDYFQMLRYLTSFKKKLGMIINFRQKYLKIKRIINSEKY